MKNVLDLNELELDALKEISNIGAGNAATSLSLALGRKIELSVPKAILMPFSEIADVLGGPEKEVAGTCLFVNGETPMGILFFIPSEQIPSFLDMLCEGTAAATTNLQQDFKLNDIQKSALEEVINILAGSYLYCLGTITQRVFIPSVPSLSIDMVGAIIGELLQNIGTVSDYALIIENTFAIEGKQLNGYFFVFPEPQTLKILLNALGV